MLVDIGLQLSYNDISKHKTILQDLKLNNYRDLQVLGWFKIVNLNSFLVRIYRYGPWKIYFKKPEHTKDSAANCEAVPHKDTVCCPDKRRSSTCMVCFLPCAIFGN